MQSRYIVWQEGGSSPRDTSVRELLDEYPDVEVLRSNDPDFAVVLMDTEAEQRIRRELPDLCVEPDVRHRMVAGR